MCLPPSTNERFPRTSAIFGKVMIRQPPTISGGSIWVLPTITVVDAAMSLVSLVRNWVEPELSRLLIRPISHYERREYRSQMRLLDHFKVAHYQMRHSLKLMGIALPPFVGVV